MLRKPKSKRRRVRRTTGIMKKARVKVKRAKINLSWIRVKRKDIRRPYVIKALKVEYMRGSMM